MADSKQRLSMTVGLIVVALFVQLLPINAFWAEILLSSLVLSLCIPSILEYRKMKILSEKNQRITTHNQEQQTRIDHLTENNLSLQGRLSEYKTLLEDLDSIAFTFDLKSDRWSIFTGDNRKTDQNNIHEGLYLIEKNVHPEDRMFFIKKTSQWLSGEIMTFEYRTLQSNGEVHWKELRPNSIVNILDEVERISGMIIDITDRKKHEEKLAQMAFYDHLTQLPNRLMLKNHLKKVLSRAKRKNHDFAIMFIDLDGFKNVNDTLGHDVGDALLKDVAIRLNSTVREEDLVSRIGGDEFIIVFEETCQEELETISSRMIDSIGNPYFLADKEAHVTPSIGIALFPDHGDEIDLLVDHADKAMYTAKNNGKSTYQFYSHDLKYEEEAHRESLIDKFRKLFQK